MVGIAVGTLCALLAAGADLVQSVAGSPHGVAPFLAAVTLALLPVPMLVAVVLLIDRLEPEPRSYLVFAFAWGAGIAALLAAVINTAGLVYITQPDLGQTTGQYISATFGAPVVEESLKGAALGWLLWRRRQEFDAATDGIVYAAMVGLGFAMTENIGYYINALVRPEVGGAQLLGVTFVFRGLLAPFAHPVFTSMTGLGAAYAATHRRAGWAFAAGLAGAMILHGLWNGLTALGLRGVAVAYVLVICVMGVLAWLVVRDRRAIIGLIWRFLPAYQPAGVVTEPDLRMLSTLRGRRAARRQARAAGGAAAARAMTDYQLAATELALAHQRAERGLLTGRQFAMRQRDLLRLMTAERLRLQGGNLA
jgi:RsiW-degrading membrane proteinase PrsW (M82 family)